MVLSVMDFLVSHADKSVSFILLHQGCCSSISERIASLQANAPSSVDRMFVYDLTGSAAMPDGITTIRNAEVGEENLRRLQFFTHPNLLPNGLAPLLVKAFWEHRHSMDVVLAYDDVPAERLLLAERMLQAGSEAVLLRDDNQQSLVLALASNEKNRRLIRHWSDCVVQSCASPDPQNGDLDFALGSSLATYLCDNVSTLHGLAEVERSRQENCLFSPQSENTSRLQLAVRKLLPSIKALQVNPSGNFVEALNLPADEIEQNRGVLITNLMKVIWGERRDLQETFDLSIPDDRVRFVDWFLIRAKIEFDLGEEFIRPIREAQNFALLANHLISPLSISSRRSADFSRGANIVGYPRAEMGMGEQLRSCADSLTAVNVPFAVNDFNAGIIASHADKRFEEFLGADNPYPINLFHINADQLPLARERLGPEFLRNRYNIGYWEWELSNFPDAWLTSIDMVDEIWAPSTFIHQAVTAKTQKPVVWMPLAVEFQIPVRQQSRPEARARFSLPESSYLFLFSFDFSSFSTRKNYQAVLKAFRMAFPKTEDVGLVLKTIRHPHQKKEFWEMLREIGDDERVHVVDTVLRKPEMRILIDVCDCFISLHRSEGFGLSIAEAMYLSKPVIATNYSGNTDFTRKENSYLVDYELIPVKSGEYVFPEGQVWANPDVEQAAAYMQRLYNNPGEGLRVGRAASEFLKREHSFKVVGRRYASRINQILDARSALAAPPLPGESRLSRAISMQRAGQMIRKLL